MRFSFIFTICLLLRNPSFLWACQTGAWGMQYFEDAPRATSCRIWQLAAAVLHVSVNMWLTLVSAPTHDSVSILSPWHCWELELEWGGTGPWNSQGRHYTSFNEHQASTAQISNLIKHALATAYIVYVDISLLHSVAWVYITHLHTV